MRQFTLVEMIVAVLLLSILTTIAVTNVSSVNREAAEVAISTDEIAVAQAVDRFMIDNHYYPTEDKNDTVDIMDGEAGEYILMEMLVPKYISKQTDDLYYIRENGEVLKDDGEEVESLFVYQRKNDGWEVTGFNTEKYLAEGQSQNVAIPKRYKGLPVVRILGRAFEDTPLESISIPDSVEEIGWKAFYNSNLTSVTIGNSVKTIGNEAFLGNKITKLTIPNSVISIGKDAFKSNGITQLKLGNSLQNIGVAAFAGNKLEEVELPDNLKTIGDWAFQSNQIKSITIPNSVTSIGASSFKKNRLMDVTIGLGVNRIGLEAFYDNSTLKKVRIPDELRLKIDLNKTFPSGITYQTK